MNVIMMVLIGAAVVKGVENCLIIATNVKDIPRLWVLSSINNAGKQLFVKKKKQRNLVN